MDRKAWRILWDNLESLLMGGVLLVLLSLLVVDIGRRVVTGSPLLWVEEMVPILFVWVVFVGAAGAIKGRFGPELGRSRQLLLLFDGSGLDLWWSVVYAPLPGVSAWQCCNWVHLAVHPVVGGRRPKAPGDLVRGQKDRGRLPRLRQSPRRVRCSFGQTP
ncbi:MAG: hypothetical protein GX980_01175 [Firmicutes bacterium]|jgi:hypothetical protein|nr:hypothetical protein [Bacillota bacterium]